MSLSDFASAMSSYYEASSLTALTFFVSWNGVLVLVFSGFTRPLVELKTRLNEATSDDGRPLYCSENFGSRCPTVTLAARNDRARDLTLSELAVLHEMCDIRRVDLAAILLIEIRELCIVTYTQRSLEDCGVLRKVWVELLPASETLRCMVSVIELDRVDGVLSDWCGESKLEVHLGKVSDPRFRRTEKLLHMVRLSSYFWVIWNMG